MKLVNYKVLGQHLFNSVINVFVAGGWFQSLISGWFDNQVGAFMPMQIHINTAHLVQS